MTEQDRTRIYGPNVNAGIVGPPHLAEIGPLETR